ncbi:MucB/RseB C-terminal domain-containing protein [bacterium SCSIO 12696]|nr:MucB/RseB C-terminal domain-containing protein [bacterium SCSIO 12696]
MTIVSAFSLAGERNNSLAAHQMLVDMRQAGRQVDYQGVFTYQQRSQLNAFQIIHQVRDGKEYEYLRRLDGSSQAAVSQPGNPLDCKRVGQGLLEQSESLHQLYRFSIMEEQRIAGRPAIQLWLTPKDYMRNGYRLWLDKQSNLLLKAEVISQVDGKLLERFQFVKLTVSQPGELRPADEHKGWLVDVDKLPCNSSEQPVAAGRWRIDQPPKGFLLADIRRQDNGRERLLYSDGMAFFSVFIEPATQLMPDGHSHRGATVAYMTYLQSHPQKLYSVSVVGEIPMPLAKRIARSIRLADH